MKIITTFAILLGLSVYNISFAEDGHDHKGHDHKEKKAKHSKDEHKHDDEDGHNHKKKKKHDDHKGHDHKDEHKHGKDEKHDDHSSHKGDEHGHSGHDDHGSPKFGKGKAIVEVKNDGKHFKLALGAIKTLKLQTIKLDSPTKGTFEIPASAVVDFQDELGVYRRNGDWFEMVEIKVVHRGKYSAKIKSAKLKKSNQIVSQGVPLLRVAHLEASGQGGQGHVH